MLFEVAEGAEAVDEGLREDKVGEVAVYLVADFGGESFECWRGAGLKDRRGESWCAC